MKNKKNPPSFPPLKKGKEIDFLSRAIELAVQVDPHKVRPNPRVGCVIVRDGKIVSEGAHEVYGGAHAEVNALGKIKNISDCEVYLTLEPCDHFEGKKTPSCTELLIQRHPKRIVVGTLDPKFGEKNIEKLRRAGIEVEVENCAKCQELNPFFEKFTRTGMPYVTLKLAQSLDGKITRDGGGYISNESSRKKVHEMRGQYSAVLTTTETVLADDPRLDCRLDSPSLLKREVEGDLKSPLIPPFFKVGRSFSHPDVIVVGKRKIPKTAKIFSISGRKIHIFPTHDIEAVLRECAKLGIDSVMTECGAVMATKLLEKNLVDEIQLFIAPEVFGKGKSGFADTVSIKNFRLTEVQNLEGDVWGRFQKSDQK